MKLSKRALAVTTAILVVGGGVAYAAITTTGSGTGQATTTATKPKVTLAATATAIDVFAVTAPIVDVTGSNTSRASLTISALSTPTVVITPGSTGTCPAASFVVTPQLGTFASPASTAQVAANTATPGSHVGELKIDYIDSNTAGYSGTVGELQNGCVGATLAFTFPEA